MNPCRHRSATRRRLALGVAAIALVLAASARHADADNVGIVQAQGGQFVLNGAPFRFVGTNAYFLLDAVNYGSPQHVTDMLSLANDLGFTVLRMWASMDGGGRGFQTAPGVYDETTARQLDWVLDQADRANVRLIVGLVNYWSEYGGMPQYVAWCAPGWPVDAFYIDPGCRQLYKDWVSYLVNRVNTVNGRRYKDDPTIFAWELANEPRSGDSTGGIVAAWVGEMAAHIKSLDPVHMVETGEEGFDTTTAGYSPLSTYNDQGWAFDGGIGTSFSRNTADPNIDFGSIHLYPESWNFPAAAGAAWITDHIRIARGLGKPLVVGEFGYGGGDRESVLDAWLTAFEAEQGGGAVVWQAICPICVNHSSGSLDTVFPPTSGMSDLLAAAASRANQSGGGAGPTTPLGLWLSGSAFSAGRLAQVQILAPSPPPPGPVDVYFAVLLPPDAGPSLGCPSRDAIVFAVDGFTRLRLSCLSASPSTFAPLLRGVAGGALPPGTSFQWPSSTPAGVYTFAVALVRSGAFADGAADPGDVLALATATATFDP